MTDHDSLPPDAVNAAADALARRQDVRAILAAALPHLRAQVLEEAATTFDGYQAAARDWARQVAAAVRAYAEDTPAGS